MRSDLNKATILMLALTTLLITPLVSYARPNEPKQDPAVLTFFERALPWYPDSSLKVVEDERHSTDAGTYRTVSVERTCTERMLAGRQTVLIDEVTSSAWLGNIGRLPSEVPIKNLYTFMDGFVPDALEHSLGMRVTVLWEAPYSEPGAVIPFTLLISTGYGEYRKPAAVTADGRFFLMGTHMPFDRDPVAYRLELLRSADVVTWDHDSKTAKVEIVEFSDFQCPGCKVKWSLIKRSIERYGSSMKHGMVGFPLTKPHPWAFRSACASWCVGQQQPRMLVPLKELFYSLQADMTVSSVTPTALDFVVGSELDEEAFRACYLRGPSLNAVHDQMGLGQSLGVMATPTFFVNGWLVQVPEEEWFFPFLEELISEGEK